MKIKHRRWIVLTGAVFTASLLQGCVVGGEGGYGYQQPYGYEDRSYGYGGWGDPYGGRSRDDAYRGYEQRRYQQREGDRREHHGDEDRSDED